MLCRLRAYRTLTDGHTLSLKQKRTKETNKSITKKTSKPNKQNKEKQNKKPKQTQKRQTKKRGIGVLYTKDILIQNVGFSV